MQRFLLACVLAVLATCGRAAETVIYYGPSGDIMAAGKYTRVTISWVNGQAVLSQQVIIDIGGVVPVPPVPPIPPVDDVTTKITGYIAAVTADPKKVETSAGLALAYKTVLDLAIIKDAATLRTVAETLIDKALADPKVMKTSTWKPFTDGMKALASPLDLAGVVNCYSIAQSLLGGGPVPPPIPPPPNPPIPIAVTGMHVLVMHDPILNGNLPQTQVDVFSSKELRDWAAANCELDKTKTPAIRFLRPGQDLSKEVDPVWPQLAAHGASSNVTDPYWVLIDATHMAVESVPKTIAEAVSRLKAFKGGS